MSSSGNSINNIYGLRSMKCSQLDYLAAAEGAGGLVEEALAAEQLVGPGEGLLVLDDAVASADHAQGPAVGRAGDGVAVGDLAVPVLGVADEDRLLGEPPAGQAAVL
jgi:hypothetical protein